MVGEIASAAPILTEIARAICWKNGMNPDLSLGGDQQNFLWMEYESQAQAALAVIVKRLREPDETMIDLFVEWRDAGSGWEKFYPRLADYLEGGNHAE